MRRSGGGGEAGGEFVDSRLLQHHLSDPLSKVLSDVNLISRKTALLSSKIFRQRKRECLFALYTKHGSPNFVVLPGNLCCKYQTQLISELPEVFFKTSSLANIFRLKRVERHV